jgi:hypothetical protein
MDANEDGTHERRKTLHRDFVESKTPGTAIAFVMITGDGVLAPFQRDGGSRGDRLNHGRVSLLWSGFRGFHEGLR